MLITNQEMKALKSERVMIKEYYETDLKILG